MALRGVLLVGLPCSQAGYLRLLTPENEMNAWMSHVSRLAPEGCEDIDGVMAKPYHCKGTELTGCRESSDIESRQCRGFITEQDVSQNPPHTTRKRIASRYQAQCALCIPVGEMAEMGAEDAQESQNARMGLNMQI
jgi:hypothetical protein